jgi:hypothetical protein
MPAPPQRCRSATSPRSGTRASSTPSAPNCTGPAPPKTSTTD